MKWPGSYRTRLILVGFIAAIVLSRIELASGATITVGPGAGCDFSTIQAGIDAANDADTVRVAPGEYVIIEPIAFRGKAITVMSEAGPDRTIIRMDTPIDPERGSVVIFENNETVASVLDGFTITGGTGSTLEDSPWGGGILFNASSGTVKNCAIVQNRVEDSGGGVFCAYQCSLILIDCIIAENSAGNSAGGVFAWEGASVTLTNCLIRDNSARVSTGGMFCMWNSSGTMTDCIITGNTAETDSGGGVKCWKDSSLSLTNCIISHNSSATWGGGLEPASGPAIVTNCIIVGNTAGKAGGGMWCWKGQNKGSVRVTNSIIRGNTAPVGRQISVWGGAQLTVMYNNIAGGRAGVDVRDTSTLNWGAGNIDTDPLFARLGYWDDNGTRDSSDDFWVEDDYHLKSQAGRWDPDDQVWVKDNVTSPCIDAGGPMRPIGWELFPNGGFVNMGAYGGTPKASKTYFGEPICEMIFAGDINGDGQVNRADLEIMALHWTGEEPLPLP